MLTSSIVCCMVMGTQYSIWVQTHTSFVTKSHTAMVLINSRRYSMFVCTTCTWNGIVQGAGQQEVEVLSVSSLFLKPRLQHRLHGEHAVFHPLQVNLRSQHQTVWWRTHINIWIKGRLCWPKIWNVFCFPSLCFTQKSVALVYSRGKINNFCLWPLDGSKIQYI